MTVTLGTGLVVYALASTWGFFFKLDSLLCFVPLHSNQALIPFKFARNFQLMKCKNYWCTIWSDFVPNLWNFWKLGAYLFSEYHHLMLFFHLHLICSETISDCAYYLGWCSSSNDNDCLTSDYYSVLLLQRFDFCSKFLEAIEKLLWPQSFSEPQASYYLCCLAY